MKKTLTAKIDGRKFEDDFEIIEAILDERNINDIGSLLRPTEEDMKNIFSVLISLKYNFNV